MDRQKSVPIDPVCGMQVDPHQSGISATFDGETYYFCAEACRQAFQQHPRRFRGAGRPKRKGPWARYLQRLNRCTGGKGLKCH